MKRNVAFGITLTRGLLAVTLGLVLLSDGEQPFPEPYIEPLKALSEGGVPVHCITIGSLEGKQLKYRGTLLNAAGKKEKKVVLEYTTKRDDQHLQKIATACADLDEFERQLRQAERAKRETLRALDAELDSVSNLIRALTHAALLSTGHHTHKGQWRKKRHV